jgi:DNA-binding transcriptional ArsR family regulator
VHLDPDVPVPAALIGNPARGAMLVALLDGKPLSAGELARIAGVSPGTASEHLSRLTTGGLIAVARSGRQRNFTLKGNQVARAIEALQALAPPRPARSLRDARIGSALSFARSCYDHLAGRLAVQLAETLILRQAIAPLVAGQKGTLLDASHPLIAQLGIEVPVHNVGRRPIVRGCLDWSEREPHLAGQLGSALLAAMTAKNWLAASLSSRALRLTDNGGHHLAKLVAVAPAALGQRE